MSQGKARGGGGLPEQGVGEGDSGRPAAEYGTELPGKRSRPETPPAHSPPTHAPARPPLGVCPHLFPGRQFLALGPPRPRPAATWLTRCRLRGAQLAR